MSLFSILSHTRKFAFADNTDFHSHILPGVDDGLKTIEDALFILSEYESLGIKEVFLTPHIMVDMPNRTDELKARFAELQSCYDGSIRLHLSAENMLDDLFVERLQNNEVLPFGKNNDSLLVETSYFTAPMGFHDMLQQIRMHGFIPVLAHPERYDYMDKEDYSTLHDMGVQFQMNLLSPSGYYGSHVKKKALWIDKQGWYSYIGSDIHRKTMLSELK